MTNELLVRVNQLTAQLEDRDAEIFSLKEESVHDARAALDAAEILRGRDAEIERHRRRMTVLLTKDEILQILDALTDKYGMGYSSVEGVGALQAKLSVMLEVAGCEGQKEKSDVEGK